MVIYLIFQLITYWQKAIWLRENNKESNTKNLILIVPLHTITNKDTFCTATRKIISTYVKAWTKDVWFSLIVFQLSTRFPLWFWRYWFYDEIFKYLFSAMFDKHWTSWCNSSCKAAVFISSKNHLLLPTAFTRNML